MAGGNKQAMADASRLISPGYITAFVHFTRGGRWTLRSLTPAEVSVILERVGPRPDNLDLMLWLLATSLWMVDGMILSSDEDSLVEIRETLKGLSPPVLSILTRAYSALSSRVSRAKDHIMLYSLGSDSRNRWLSEGRTVSGVTIPGMPNLGRTEIQRVWAYFNMVEDDYEDTREEWERSYLVASTQAPKEVQKIRQKDINDDQRRSDRLKSMAESWARGVVDPGKASKILSYGIHSKGEDELREEYVGWVSGRVDEHDRVVSEHKKAILDRNKTILQALVVHDDAVGGRVGGVTSTTNMVGMTYEQFLEHMGGAQTDHPGARMVYDVNPSAKAYLSRLVGEESAPAIEIVDGKVVTKAPNPSNASQMFSPR